MEIFLLIIGGLLSLVGLAGSVLPALPGAPLNFIAIVILYLVREDSVSITALIIFVILAILAMLVDYLLPILRAKKHGTSKQGIFGSIVGMLLGLIVFSFVGMIVGAFLGAVIGELYAGKEKHEAVRSGLAAFLGTVLATVAKFVISFSMAIYFFVKLF